MQVRLQRGFTVIEALVAFAVLAILAAIGVPNYSRYVARSTLVEASTALAEYRTNMEHFYQHNRTYAKHGQCARSVPQNVANFAISCSVTPRGDAFVASATGIGANAGVVYTIDQTDARATRAIPSHWGELPRDASHKWVTR